MGRFGELVVVQGLQQDKGGGNGITRPVTTRRDETQVSCQTQVGRCAKTQRRQAGEQERSVCPATQAVTGVRWPIC